MPVPKILTVGMKRGNVVPAVNRDELELTIAVKVMHSDRRLDFAHLKGKTLAHVAVTVDNIYEADTCTEENF
jgi:23S rRNA maturation-related 3'-5' exoribonuclease YhaM